MRKRFLPWFAFAGLVLTSNQAHAGKYDLDLTRFGTLQNNGQVSTDTTAFRSLSSELGVVMAPKPVDPGDSLGLSGFALGADFSLNTISDDQGYWRDPTDGDASQLAGSMQILGRKGLWPGIELGGGATHMFDSRMWSLGGYVKAALHEGFHHLPIPTIALRAQFAQLLGAPHMKMSMITPGVSVSHVFGAGKTVNLTPYLGYEALLVISQSNVLDATPSCDEYDDYNGGCSDVPNNALPEFVFDKQSVIVRHRPYLGMRFIFSVIRVVIEGMWVPAGSTEDSGESASDNSQFQQQYTLSLGLDF